MRDGKQQLTDQLAGPVTGQSAVLLPQTASPEHLFICLFLSPFTVFHQLFRGKDVSQPWLFRIVL